MQSHQDEITKASKTAQKEIAETGKKIGDTTLRVQNEFVKTFAEQHSAPRQSSVALPRQPRIRAVVGAKVPQTKAGNG